MKLLILHPEGNVTNNPHLFGLLELLTARKVAVDIVIPDRPDVAAGSIMPGCTVVKTPAEPRGFLDHTLLLRGVPDGRSGEKIAAFINEYGPYDFVIGIDRGIIEAAAIADAMSTPLGLLSYEIYFRDECGVEFKKPEVEACRAVRFAVSQDNLRGALLCEENEIPADRLLLMPVAGAGLRVDQPVPTLQSALGLPPETRTLLCMGALASEWSGVRRLVESAAMMPEGWVLVLHHRYGWEDARYYLEPMITDPERVLPSPFDILPPTNLRPLLAGADLGAAIYTPTFDDYSSGKNTLHVGLSSGKRATYLQHGVPVLINDDGEMSEMVRAYSAGVVIDDFVDIPDALSGFGSMNQAALRQNAATLFSEKLDLGPRMPALFEALGLPA